MIEERSSVYFAAPFAAVVRAEELAPPALNQVLVQTIVSAISPGTEMLFYRGQAPPDLSVDATITALTGAVRYPLKYGYACVGRVIDVGAAVDARWRGRLVFAFNPHESHFVTEPSQLIPVPDGVEPTQAALLPSMETAVNFLMDGHPMLGERVAVLGQGVVGLLTTALLTRFPLSTLVTLDRFAMRRNQSRAWGAQDVYDPVDAPDLRDFDLVYELSGNPAALNQAIQMTGFGGRVVIGSWYGQKRAEMDLGGHFHRSRIQLISSQVSTIAPSWTGRWDKARRMAVAWSMLSTVDVTQLISHRFPVAEAARAYQLIDQQPEQTIQVLLVYDP